MKLNSIFYKYFAPDGTRTSTAKLSFDWKRLTDADKKKWADAYMWFYRRLSLKHGGKPLVMKTPANAARLKLLTKLFPDARYIYLSRNPLKVFPSTVKLWRALYSVQGLHNPPYLDSWRDD